MIAYNYVYLNEKGKISPNQLLPYEMNLHLKEAFDILSAHHIDVYVEYRQKIVRIVDVVYRAAFIRTNDVLVFHIMHDEESGEWIECTYNGSTMIEYASAIFAAVRPLCCDVHKIIEDLNLAYQSRYSTKDVSWARVHLDILNRILRLLDELQVPVIKESEKYYLYHRL